MREFEIKIREVFGVHENDLQKISNYFSPKQLRKDEFLFKKGQSCEQLIFLKSGYLRIYNQVDDKEVTQWISSPSYFVTDAAFFLGNKCRWNIQALTDVSFFSISRKKYLKLKNDITDWGEIEKRFILYCFITLEDRVNQLISLNAQERYQQVFENNKDLFNQVPLQYIASMLGMTAETLSRMRKKNIS